MDRKNTIKKNKEGYGYTYTDITAINNYCMENGITYYQEVETCEVNSRDYIITYLTENNETKRYRGCEIVQATLQGIKNPVQEYGSSLTYCRRYSLLMALALATDDNDAQDLTIPTLNTKEDALKMTINFGKYNGKTLSEIQDDESYLEYLFNNSKDENMVKAVSLITGWEIKSEEEQKEEVKIVAQYKKLLDDTNTLPNVIPGYYYEKGIEKMGIEEYKKAIKMLEEKKKKQEKK